MATDMHPGKIERAENLAVIVEKMCRAMIARHVHQSTNDDPLNALHAELVAALATVIR